ncbi:MAG: glycosyltransferase family 4 protein [bacterium]|nr:glycosyltransferase family 4 protein [bacterium]
MKILMLTPYLPYPLLSGGQIRTYNLLKKLATKHEITLFALIKEKSELQYIPELEKYCKKVKVFKRSKTPFTLKNILQTAFSSYPFLVIRNYVPEAITAIEEELKSTSYDLIHAETFYMMPHLPVTTVPTILVEQTIEYLGYESYAQQVKFAPLRHLLKIDIAKIKKWETFFWNSCNKLIVMSDEDKSFIAATLDNPNKIDVVSNGVDSDWFADKERTQPQEPTILSVGTFKWLPNVEAVTFLVNKVWPLIKAKVPNARLWIVGNAPTQEVLEFQHKDTSITVTGGIPDIRDAFCNADVLLAPVFSGKGTRYKILEAMASGTPIVATPTAVEGLGVTNNVEVLTSETAEGLAKLTISLLEDKQQRLRLAKKGRAFVTGQYDWEGISKKLDAIYRQIGATTS